MRYLNLAGVLDLVDDEQRSAILTLWREAYLLGSKYDTPSACADRAAAHLLRRLGFDPERYAVQLPETERNQDP